MGRQVALDLIEDNESTVQIIKTGKNPTMRHMFRTHGVNVMRLHDLYHKGLFGMTYTRTEAWCVEKFIKSCLQISNGKMPPISSGSGILGVPKSSHPNPGPAH